MDKAKLLVRASDRPDETGAENGGAKPATAEVAWVALSGFRGALGSGLREVIERDAALRAVVCEDAEELSMVIADQRPDVLLVWCEALGSVVELWRLVLRRPETGVVVAVPHESRHRDDAFLSAGARVVVPLSMEAEELRAALRLVARGLVGPPGPPLRSATAGLGLLTAREAQVVELLVERLSALEIAEALHVSEATVNSHRRHIYEKLGVHSRRELALRAELLSRDAPDRTAPAAHPRASLAYRRRPQARERGGAVMIDMCRALRAPRWLERSA